MINEFIQHIRAKNLFEDSKKYLLAISGGADSVCLGHLLHAAGINFELAHVNYHLRNEESNDDEDFVRGLAKFWEVNLYVKNGIFNKNDFPGKSLQMIAREIRYQWFNDLINDTGCAAILVAHHFEDQMETILLNQLRGSGIEGMSGMSEKRDKIIRPLLPFRKDDLVDFLIANNFPWREDSSNQKNLYKRNFLRNELIPLLVSEFPKGLEGLDHTAKRLRDTGKAFFYLFDHWKATHVFQEDGYHFLELKDIRNISGIGSMLYYWLRDYGFTYSVVQEIIHSLETNESGKIFQCSGFEVNLDREHLILGEVLPVKEEIHIHEHDIELEEGFSHYDLLKVSSAYPIDYSSINAMLDFDKLKFPLILRTWREGDRFIPIGMKSQKKVSDLLVDLKVPVIRKKQIRVLISGNEIIWVLGYRISEQYKRDQSTKSVYYLKKRV
jgi:tRNA(Ile)-lysidine synthase